HTRCGPRARSPWATASTAPRSWIATARGAPSRPMARCGCRAGWRRGGSLTARGAGSGAPALGGPGSAPPPGGGGRPSAGRWIWDPRFGWTWLDTAPWGWAPYHYGRWVFVNNFWAWAPGPVIVRPAYAPALVVFLGGVTVSFGRPVCWAPLACGEPLVPL